MMRSLCSAVLFLQILIRVHATSRLLSPDNDLSSHQFGTSNSQKISHSPDNLIQGGIEQTSKTARYRGVKKIGSRPPDCEHKCEGCIPCLASIQVPIITSHFVLHYANYEPVSWKCQCGPSFFTP